MVDRNALRMRFIFSLENLRSSADSKTIIISPITPTSFMAASGTSKLIPWLVLHYLSAIPANSSIRTEGMRVFRL
jgi:hypothetical protein